MKHSLLVLICCYFLLIITVQNAHSIPSGKILFTSDGDGNFGIYEMNTNGTDIQKLISGSERNTSDRWFADRKKVVCIRNNSEIWMMDSDGTNEGYIRNGSYVTFSAGGKYLAYTDSHPSNIGPEVPGGFALFSYDIQTKTAAGPLSFNVNTDARDPRWSINNEIAFIQYTTFFSVDKSNLYVYNLDSLAETFLTDLKIIPPGKQYLFIDIPS